MWPIGVVVSIPCRRPGRIRECQSAACLAWLQDSHRPCPLVLLVGPPSWWAWRWSTCRTGASHHGVRRLDRDGIRLTHLAERALMTPQAMSELVEHLVSHGYLERMT